MSLTQRIEHEDTAYHSQIAGKVGRCDQLLYCDFHYILLIIGKTETLSSNCLFTGTKARQAVLLTFGNRPDSYTIKNRLIAYQYTNYTFYERFHQARTKGHEIVHCDICCKKRTFTKSKQINEIFGFSRCIVSIVRFLPLYRKTDGSENKISFFIIGTLFSNSFILPSTI